MSFRPIAVLLFDLRTVMSNKKTARESEHNMIAGTVFFFKLTSQRNVINIEFTLILYNLFFANYYLSNIRTNNSKYRKWLSLMPNISTLQCQPGELVGKNDKAKDQLTACGIVWPGHVQLTHLDVDHLTIPEFATLEAAENWFTQSCLHTGSGSILRNGTGHIGALGFHSFKHPPLGIVASIAVTYYSHVPCTNKMRTCEVKKLLKCMMLSFAFEQRLTGNTLERLNSLRKMNKFTCFWHIPEWILKSISNCKVKICIEHAICP